MSSKGRLSRYVRLAFVALAFVLYPYLVNQLPALEDLLKDVPPIMLIIAALIFAAVVVVGPELLNEKENSSEELWQKFAQGNQEKIRERLKGNLYQDGYIPLDWDDSPIDLDQPVTPSQPSRSQRLLILGEPGSGKTTKLLRVAQTLAKKAAQNPEKPIPVIFELSTWREEKILDWMVEQMAEMYGLKPELCRQWLSTDRIMPLLDGLDELGQERMKKAIHAIEQLQDNYQQQQKFLVICCRVKDYESTTTETETEPNCRLRFRKLDRAVRLRQLTDEQIQHYLDQRKASHLWEDLGTHPEWKQLAKNPMLLNLMPIAYRYPERLPGDALEDIAACQKQLFDAFLAKKLPQLDDYKEKDKDPRHYLAWLAASMGKEGINQREFLIESLQPTWLENARQYRHYRLIIGLIVGLIFGLIIGLIVGLIFGLIIGLIVGLIFGLILDHTSIQLTEALDLSWQGIKRELRLGLKWALIVGLIGGLIGGLIIGLIVGLIGGLIVGLRADLKVRQRPNEGIKETGIKTLITIGLAMPLCPLMVIVPNWATGQEVDLLTALIQGAGMGIILGFLAGGGVALIQHFALRWVLFHQGNMPENYAHFLTQASQAGILKQSGGRFRFYHDTLREHLAQEVSLPAYTLPPHQINWGLVLILFFMSVWLPRSIDTFSAQRITNVGLDPIFRPQDTVFIDRLTHRFRPFHRGDIIFFEMPELSVIKYIIAEPQETLEIRSGEVFINDEPLDTGSIELPPTFNQPPITLNSDEYYAIVTDPDYKYQDVGQVVSRQQIRGQVIFRLYPFHRFGSMNN